MDDKPRWDKVDKIAKRLEDDKVKLEDKGALEIQVPAEFAPDLEQPTDIITKYKTNKIMRQAAIEKLQAWSDAQIEVQKTFLTEAVKAKQEQIASQAMQFMEEIGIKHLAFLNDIGLKNQGVRNDTVVRLIDQTKKTIHELQTRQASGDYPDFLIEEAIEGVIKSHRDFHKKITTDELHKKIK
jgi:predicted transcriptional regulator